MLGEPNLYWASWIVANLLTDRTIHGTWGGLAVQEENDRYIVVEGGAKN